MNELMEHRMYLILWGMDLSHLPEGHPFTEQLRHLQERAEKKLTEAEKHASIRAEYQSLKDRMFVLEQDYARILK